MQYTFTVRANFTVRSFSAYSLPEAIDLFDELKRKGFWHSQPWGSRHTSLGSAEVDFYVYDDAGAEQPVERARFIKAVNGIEVK